MAILALNKDKIGGRAMDGKTEALPFRLRDAGIAPDRAARSHSSTVRTASTPETTSINSRVIVS